MRPDAVTPGRQARTAPTVVVEMADTEGHSQKFADAFSSILADETGPEKKKRRKVKADAVRNQQLRPGSLPQFEMQSDGALLDARVARKGPILSRVDTSAADRQEVAEKKKLRAARKAKAVRRMVRGKDRVSTAEAPRTCARDCSRLALSSSRRLCGCSHTIVPGAINRP